MKKLRLFDSLKFVVAAIVCTFISNVAHADTSINSVIAYGKTEQSATPTPTNPVPIMTNNGELKVSPNLFDALKAQLADISTVTGGPQATTRRILSDFIPIKPNTKYTASGTFNIDGNNSVVNRLIYAYYDANKGYIENSRTATTTGTTTITTTNNASYKYIRIVYFAATGTNASIANSRLRFEEGSTATTGVYVDGLTETIRDSAGHTATAQMLLGLNDEYRDEQNINTGAITRKVGVKVLDGTEDWGEVSNGRGYWFPIGVSQETYTNVIGLCSHFDFYIWDNNSVSMPVNKFGFNKNSSTNTTNGNITFRPDLTIYSSVSAWTQYLAEQYANGTPVIIVYPLATETTESVATQSLTTAPVRQTAGSILGMPIEVILSDNTSQWVTDVITIATTKYNEESFAPVKTDLSAAVNAVEYVVSNTMTQAQAIDQIATSKQTRPDEGCPAKYCLLVEDEDGTPHWYPIAGANGVAHALPAGYTELQYTYMTSGSYLLTDIVPTYDCKVEMDFLTTTLPSESVYFVGGRTQTYGGLFFARTVNRGFIVDAFGTRYNSNVEVSNDTRYKFTYNNQVAKVESAGTTLFTNTFTGTDATGAAFCINGLNTNGTITTTNSGIYLYSFRVWNAQGELVANYIPAKQTNPLSVGFYDTVSKTFKTATAGTFTAGPDM